MGVEIGTVGRLDDMKKVKGINVWPQAVDEALFQHDGVDEYQVIVARDESQADTVTLQMMPKPDVAADQLPALCQKIGEELRRRIGIGFLVVAVAPGALKHSEYKARRWIDRR